MFTKARVIFKNTSNLLTKTRNVLINHRSVSNIRSVNVENRNIVLNLIDKETNKINNLKYPLVWLRDNCQCSECFHTVSNSRTINWETFKLNVKPKELAFEKELTIVWDDNHSSTYDVSWLIDRNFSSANRERYLQAVYRPRFRLWSKNEFNDVIQKFQFNDVLNTDEGLRSWLESLSINGCAMIENAPLTENECRKIADRVGFIKKTHYGEEFFVRAKDGTSNVAYLSTPLQIHTDLPYYEYKPGVNLLHCIVQSNSPGAFNLLTDGFYVADRIKKEYPKYYETLTTTLVNWSDYGNENGNAFQKVYRAPVISLDYESNLERINHSVPQRDSYFSVDIDHVDGWYEAMRKFVELIHEEAVEFKTKPGDILTFSNIRLLHGRTGYVDQNGNVRHLVGAYIDWDEIYSRLRVLNESTTYTE